MMRAVDENLRQVVHQAAARDDVVRAVRALYDDVQAEVDRRRPLCVISGRCCRFEEYGHRLYVTTLELAAFVHDLARAGRVRLPTWDGAGCPYQAGKLCGVHPIRPFGCRMFFCDATSTAWQTETYEHFHSRIKALHHELKVPYHYLEWRQALNLLDTLSVSPNPEP